MIVGIKPMWGNLDKRRKQMRPEVFLIASFLVCLPFLLAMVADETKNRGGKALFEDLHVIKKKKAMHGYRGIMGDFIQLKDGSLLMSYTDGDIKVVKSRDKGKTWSRPKVLVPRIKPPHKGGYGAPGFLRLKNGDILLTYNYTTHPATPYFAMVYYRRSIDDGNTWGDQFTITPCSGYTLVHNDKLFTIESGRIIAMAEHKEYMPSKSDHAGYVGMSFYSDDNGYSWFPSKNKVDLYKSKKIDVQEPDAVELKDGRLLMFARTYSGFPVRAYSKDKGETWSKGQLIKELKMPYAGLPTVRRIPSTGDLLFIWINERSVDKKNPKVHWRCALATAISRDEGKTFIHKRQIARDPEDDFGYQCIEFIGENLALVGYHKRDGVYVARIGIDWFYRK